MDFLRYRDGNGLQYVAVLLSLLIACSPFVDYYFDWYITILPILVVFISLVKSRRLFRNIIWALFLALLFVLLQYWVVYRRQDLLTILRNGMMAFTPLITAFFLKEKAGQSFKKDFLQVLVLMMTVTAITTIYGLQFFPDACRELAGNQETEEAELFIRMNIGGFDFIYGIVVFIPILFWLIKNTSGVYKCFNIIATIILLYCVYLSSYATALLLSIVALMLVIIERKTSYRPLIIIFFIFLLILTGTGILSDMLLSLSQIVGSEYVSDRLLQLSLALGGADIGTIQTETSTERLELLRNALNGFFSSPLYGHNLIWFSKQVISGHSMVMDLLSGSGLFGFSICVYLFYHIFRLVVMKIGWRITPCTRAVWILFIIASLFNPSGFFIVYLISFSATVCEQSLTFDC